VRAKTLLLQGATTTAALGVLVASHGCSMVLNIDSNRHVTQPLDAATSDAGVNDWSCLSAPNEEFQPGLQTKLTLVVMDGQQPSTSAGAIDGGSDLDTVNGTWLGGVTVRSCPLRDLDCDSSAAASQVTDSLGLANFDLAQDFVWYFDLRRPDLVPTTLYPGNLLANDSIASFPAYAVTPSEFDELAASIMVDDAGLDPNGSVGHVLVTIYDCKDHQATGVAVTFSPTTPGMVPFYLDGLPNRNATATDDYGIAGAVNVPVGSVAVSAYLPATPTRAAFPVGMTTFSVRAGAVTEAWIRARTH
jgi:hypothetical protein